MEKIEDTSLTKKYLNVQFGEVVDGLCCGIYQLELVSNSKRGNGIKVYSLILNKSLESKYVCINQFQVDKNGNKINESIDDIESYAYDDYLPPNLSLEFFLKKNEIKEINDWQPLWPSKYEGNKFFELKPGSSVRSILTVYNNNNYPQIYIDFEGDWRLKIGGYSADKIVDPLKDITYWTGPMYTPVFKVNRFLNSSR